MRCKTKDNQATVTFKGATPTHLRMADGLEEALAVHRLESINQVARSAAKFKAGDGLGSKE